MIVLRLGDVVKELAIARDSPAILQLHFECPGDFVMALFSYPYNSSLHPFLNQHVLDKDRITKGKLVPACSIFAFCQLVLDLGLLDHLLLKVHS